MIAAVMLVLFCLLAVPFILVGAVLGVVLFLVGQILLLPFRLLGLAAGMTFGIVSFFINVALVILLGLFVMAGLVVGLAPLLPLLLIFAGIWLLARSHRSRRGSAPART
ncbi:MAG: hypothetical protein ACREAA_16220 [Candidatus Polarisedimenticolia bacterium]